MILHLKNSVAPTQVEAIEPTACLIVYDTTTNNLKCYDGSAWNNLF